MGTSASTWKLGIAALSLTCCGSSDESSCDPSSWQFSGDVGSQSVSGSASADMSNYLIGWTRTTAFANGGSVHIWGEGAALMDQTITSQAVLFAPSGSSIAGSVLFSAATTTKPATLDAPIRLEQLHAVGSCPGTPVQGSLSVCLDSIERGCPEFATGTFDGQELSHSVTVRIDMELVGRRLAVVNLDEDGFFVLSGDPYTGILVLPSTSPDPLAVHCVDSVEVSHQDGPKTFLLAGISRAGTSPGAPVDGSVDLTPCPD